MKMPSPSEVANIQTAQANQSHAPGTSAAEGPLDRRDSQFNEHVLLTPPAQSIPADPPTNLDQHTLAAYSSAQLSHALHENYTARRENSQYKGTESGPSISGREGIHLLDSLAIKTDMSELRRSTSVNSCDSDTKLRSSASVSSLPQRVPSIRARLHSTAGSLSPGSVISSPQISAMLDITPLPSPTMGTFETWKTVIRTRSRGSSASSKSDLPAALLPPSTIALSSPRRKGYAGLSSSSKTALEDQGAMTEASRARTRSVSEYVPEALAVPKPRAVAVSGSGPPVDQARNQTPMHREEYLGVQRGIVSSVVHSPPPTFSEDLHGATHGDEPAAKRPKLEVFSASSISTGQGRKYESIRKLGQGTFSKVYLALRQVSDRNDAVDYRKESVNMAGVRARLRRLVAVKIIEHGPAGGADAERIEVSLKREVDLLKSVKHPSLVHLKAFGTDGSARALLVMNYCPGGDLFDVASTKLEVLTPPLVRRIFAELVSAVRYLHQKYIVHRDIKLENVLLNIPISVHSDVADWQSLDRAVVTLTDLGLSRRIPEPPESPLLTTRCGSEDYAAPELLMGQPYDGRQTDAWALGVLLYALMEGRLPFDPLPGARGDPATLRARTPHRIARCEWAWVKYGDDDGDWDAEKGREFQEAYVCVDGLLKRTSRRKALTELRDLPWIKDGIKIDGGLKWVEEETL